MSTQKSPPSINTPASISTSARRHRRARQNISPATPTIAELLEDPNDGDKDSDEDADVDDPSIPVFVLTTPLPALLESENPPVHDAAPSPPAPVRAVGFPVVNARRTGLQAKERAIQRISGSVPPAMLARRPSGRRWRAHAPDYDDELARIHLFRPPLPPTHTDKRRVAVYYTCEQIALFKLQKWMDKNAKEHRRAYATEAKKEATMQAGLGLTNWKNRMYLEVLHSSYKLERPADTAGEDRDPCAVQRAAALQEKHAFFFETGCCVFWGLTREEEARCLMTLTPFSSGMKDQVDAQDMEFSYGDRSSIAKDSIVLCSLNVAEKIALSFAMSQSATLGAFETRVEDRIRSTKHIPSSLASVGSIQYSQNDTSKLIGHLFIELADVNIHSNVLDEPEYFLKSQDNDDFKYLYVKMLKYQDVASRVAILNKRLSILRDLVGVLNQQLTHHHGAKLEWIIIWMLVFQVIIAIGWDIILKDILGYFHWG
ncbi:hypothetical protein PInf_020557 [Phytophthora infestans]|nr:hypothetical protein PInf_020557 [Phytophthora infestans]